MKTGNKWKSFRPVMEWGKRIRKEQNAQFRSVAKRMAIMDQAMSPSGDDSLTTQWASRMVRSRSSVMPGPGAPERQGDST